MSSKSIYLREFCDHQLIFDDQETKAILTFFFPDDTAQIEEFSVNSYSRSFAQGLLVEAVDRSYDLSMVGKLMGFIYRKHASITSLLKKLVKQGSREWYKHANRSDLEAPRVAETVRRALARSFRSHLVLMLNGAQSSSGHCQSYIDFQRFLGSRILWG